MNDPSEYLFVVLPLGGSVRRRSILWHL